MTVKADRCTAKAKSTQHRCQRLVRGGGVCIVHGGAAPQVRARREARLLAAEAAESGAGVLVDRSPAEALLAAAKDADQVVQRLRAQMANGELTATSLIALGDWLDRVARVSKVVLDANIDERRTRLAEDQGQLIADGLRWLAGSLVVQVLEPALGDAGRVAVARRQVDALQLQMLQHLSAGSVPALEAAR